VVKLKRMSHGGRGRGLIRGNSLKRSPGKNMVVKTQNDRRRGRNTKEHMGPGRAQSVPATWRVRLLTSDVYPLLVIISKRQVWGRATKCPEETLTSENEKLSKKKKQDGHFGHQLNRFVRLYYLDRETCGTIGETPEKRVAARDHAFATRFVGKNLVSGSSKRQGQGLNNQETKTSGGPRYPNR